MSDPIYWISVDETVDQDDLERIFDHVEETIPEDANGVVTTELVEPVDRDVLIDQLEGLLEAVKEQGESEDG